MFHISPRNQWSTYSVDLAEKGAVLGLLKEIDNCVIDGVPVLVQPSRAVVRHRAGIVDDGKVSVPEQ